MAELIEPPAPRILFDTSALYAPHHRILIHRFASGQNPAFTPLWSEWILAELYYSLAWSWASRAPSIDNQARRAMAASARQMLTHMLGYFEIVTLRGALPFGVAASFLPDVNDRHLYAAAVLGSAHSVVLRDARVERSAGVAWHGIDLINADEFFAALEAEEQTGEEPEPDE